MRHSDVSFNDVVLDVKQATGIRNIRNYYTDIRNLFVRAEQEINPYSGFLIKKRMLFIKGNGNFDGKKIKKPSDFISLIEVGECGNSICKCKLIQTLQYIQLCCQYDSDRIELYYYAIQKDGNGNPLTTVNHREAVVAFIVMHLYKPKIFTGNGNRGAYKDFESDWENRCHEARGEDFMPTENEIQEMSSVFRMSSIQLKSYKKDTCLSCDCIDIVSDEKVFQNENLAYWWQFNSLQQKILNAESITNEFLSEQNTVLEENLFEGVTYSFPYIGRYCFAIKTTTPDKIKCFDILGISMEDSFNKYYDVQRNLLMFCTKEFITNGSIYLKFTNG